MSTALADGQLFLRTVRETESEMTVFGLMVRKPALDRYLQALKVAKIQPRNVELRSLAMTRAVNLPDAVIINVERTALDIVIVDGDLPVVMRSSLLNDGGDAVRQAAGMVVDVVNAYRRQPAAAGLQMPAVLTGALSEEPELRQAVQGTLKLVVEPLSCPFKAPPGFAAANFAVNIGLALKLVT
jgi:hypothetical protein